MNELGSSDAISAYHPVVNMQGTATVCACALPYFLSNANGGNNRVQVLKTHSNL